MTPGTPDERTLRLLSHVRQAWAMTADHPELRRQTLRWLELHPSSWQAIDDLWATALEGRGSLADWLDDGADPETWSLELPLHSVLSSHPFVDLDSWSIRQTFRAS